MDAFVAVWFTSVIGAAAFSGAGYVLGLSQRPAAAPAPAPVVLPPPQLPAKPEPKALTAAPESKRPEVKAPDSKKVDALEEIEAPPPTKRTSVPAGAGPNLGAAGSLNFKTPTAFPPPAFSMKPEDDDEDRPTLVPDRATQAAVLQSSVVTIPPPQRAPSLNVPGVQDQQAMRAMIQDALAQVEHAVEQAKALEVVKNELERQLEKARSELRNEVIARAAAEKNAEELSDRLVRASEEASSLRHRVNMLDKQTKLLRESLKGGGSPSRGSGEIPRVRRDLEEAEEMRAKLRDVVDKLERASLPPNFGNPNQTPIGSRVTTPPAPRVQSGGDEAVLREEIARLATENRTLRAQTLGSLPPKNTNPRDSVPEIDLPMYEGIIERLGNVAGLKCAVLADEVGSLVLGHGDLAENLAAFGAYIRDASTRTERLLPLEGVEEVDIRDRAGTYLSTRVVMQQNSLSIVLLASADAALAAAKKVIDDRLRLRG